LRIVKTILAPELFLEREANDDDFEPRFNSTLKGGRAAVLPLVAGTSVQ